MGDNFFGTAVTDFLSAAESDGNRLGGAKRGCFTDVLAGLFWGD